MAIDQLWLNYQHVDDMACQSEIPDGFLGINKLIHSLQDVKSMLVGISLHHWESDGWYIMNVVEQTKDVCHTEVLQMWPNKCFRKWKVQTIMQSPVVTLPPYHLLLLL
jgi:hypothetical protein